VAAPEVQKQKEEALAPANNDIVLELVKFERNLLVRTRAGESR
jgi:hypothetical protein